MSTQQVQINDDVEFQDYQKNAYIKIQELQTLQKQKFDFDVTQLDNNPQFKSVYMKLISNTKQTKELSTYLIKYIQDLETKVISLQEQIQDLSQKQQPNVLVTDQSKGDLQKQNTQKNDQNKDNNNQNQNQDDQMKSSLAQMDQSIKGSQKILDNSQNNNDLMKVSGINDEKDRIIEELNQKLKAKNQDLMIAAELENENKSLQEAIHYLENENQELKNQFGMRNQTQQMDFTERSRFQEQIADLIRQNQYFCEQYELLKQKSDQQEVTLEYLVAENSRLIIKSFAVTDRKYKV